MNRYHSAMDLRAHRSSHGNRTSHGLRSPTVLAAQLALCLSFCVAAAQGAPNSAQKTTTSKKAPTKSKKDAPTAKSKDAGKGKAKAKAKPKDERATKPKPTSQKRTQKDSASRKKQTREDDLPVAAEAGGLRPSEAASWLFFVDGAFRHDSGRLAQRERKGRAEQEQNTDIKAFGPLFHFGALKKVGKYVGVGAAFGYGADYNLSERLSKEQRENDEEPERYRMGQLLSLDARLEWSGHVSDKVAIAITPLAGITTVLAGGALRAATDAVDDSHFVGPRLGFVVGGDLGVRYYFNHWFSLKGGVGFNYFVQQLLHAKARGETADSKVTWKVSASRMTGVLAFEASF